MKNNRLRYAAPGAALALALLLSSCATPGPAGEPSSGSATTPQVAEKPGLTFSTPVTSDLEQFVKAGQTWAVQTQGEVLFAGNKAVSVYQVDPSSEIQVTVFNLDDGSTVGTANLEPLAKAEQLEDSNPVGQVMIRHDGTDFLAVTQNGFLSSTTARGVEDETDAKVSFIELGNPANVVDFEQRNRSVSSPDVTASVGSARQLVTLSGYLASEDKVQTFYATPDGVFEAKASAEETNSPLGVVALSQGEPVVQGEVGVMAFELKVSDGWDVVRSIDKLEKYPVGLMEVLALEGNLISFYYGFNEEEPHYGSYLVDLDTRKITQTSREGKESEGFSSRTCGTRWTGNTC